MEHIEEAGIHSGDSSCVIPPHKVIDRHVALIRDYTRRIARELKVVGLMNVQYATKDNVVYVLEVNPRASRTVPYLSKATGVSLAKVAAKVMAGRPWRFSRLATESAGVLKSPVFLFVRSGRRQILAENEMTGEVMGGLSNFGVAFAKAQLARTAAARNRTAFVRSTTTTGELSDCARSGEPVPLDRDTRTAVYLRAYGSTDVVQGVQDARTSPTRSNGSSPDVNTPLGRESFFDDRAVRRAAMMHQVPDQHAGPAPPPPLPPPGDAGPGSASARCRTTRRNCRRAPSRAAVFDPLDDRVTKTRHEGTKRKLWILRASDFVLRRT
jgi:carbamoyl-phosphate synthase large subunit